jgi:autotransporter-associated beta strand protein
MTNNHAPKLYPLFFSRTLRAAALLAAALLTAHLAPAQVSNIWSGTGTDLKWSDAANWSGLPLANGNNVLFLQNGTNNASPGPFGISNSVVDTSFSVGALIYDHTNCYQTTYIPTNVTLTVGGSSALYSGATFLVGDISADEGANSQNYTTILGPGTLLFTNSTYQEMKVRQGSNKTTHRATLDMSGLSTFTAYASQINVAADGTGGAFLGYPSGTLLLAQTNFIVCSGNPGLFIGESQGTAANGIVYLGQTNAIFADNGIQVGARKSTSYLGFNTNASANLVNPTALFRNTAGSGPMNYFGIADQSEPSGDGTGGTPNNVGTVDFTGAGGYVDLQATTLIVGRGPPVSGTGIGTLLWTNGIINATTLMEIGDGVFANAPGEGTVSVGGAGQLTVGSGNSSSYLRLGNTASGSTSYGYGHLNIGLPIPGGSVWINGPVVEGGAPTDYIQVLGGSLKVSGPLGSTTTTPASTGPLQSMTLSNATLTFDLGSTPNPTTPWWQVAVLNITVPGVTVTNNVLGSALTPGQFSLLKYGSYSDYDTSGFTQGTLPPHINGYLSNNTANSSIDLVILSVSSPKWNGQTNGANIGNWDINTTPDWLPVSGGGGAITYLQASAPGDSVLFDDTANGTTTVNLTTTLSPTSITLNNTSKNYTFTGSGGLSGTTTLTKGGTGSLTLSNTGTNNFTGAVAVNQGAVILSGSANLLPTGAAVTLANDPTALLNLGNTNQTLGSLLGGGASGGNVNLGTGTLTLSGGGGNYSGVISGSGGVVVSGGTQTFSGTNAYSGGTLVSSGTLIVANTDPTGSGTGSGSVTVQPGGALQIGDSGADGSIAAGVITNNGTLYLDRSDTFTLSAFITGTGGLNQEGAGTSTITNANSYSGLTTISGGTLLVSASGGLGTGPLSITSVATALLELSGGITLTTGQITVSQKANGSDKPAIVNHDGTNILTGAMTIMGGGTYWNIETEAGDLILQGPISLASTLLNGGNRTLLLSGAGNAELWGNINSLSGETTSVSIGGGGTWTFWGTNSYTGGTGLSAGQLNVNGALTGTSAVTVNGATLSGNGFIAGPVAINANSSLLGNSALTSLAPSGAPAGQLTISNTLTLDPSSSTYLGVSDLGYDGVTGLSQVSLAGNLYVVVTGPLIGGEAFKLFNAATYTGAGFNLPPTLPYLGPLLGWDYSTLNVDGTLRVTGRMPEILSVTSTGPGNFQFSGQGPTNWTYTIVASTNVALPLSEWEQVSSGAFSANGTFTFTETQAGTYRERYYRVVTPIQ